jgi:tetratricopeptide (TPR) repeat protein
VASHTQNMEGVRLYQQGYYQPAAAEFQKAIASNPKNPDGYYNLAATYHKIGLLTKNDQELKQAEEYYHQCLDRNENHRDCYRGLAVLLAQEGRKDEAYRLLESWSNKQPSSSAPKVELARLSEEFGKLDVAKAHLEDALMSDPHDPRALAALARLQEHSGDTRQALNNYQRSLWHDRFQPEVAARVSSLSRDLSATPVTTATGQTRVVNGSPPVTR